MREISKLKARLKNVQRNVTEYRMTVTEAQALLAEIENIIKTKPEEKLQKKVVEAEPTTINRIIDGGTF